MKIKKAILTGGGRGTRLRPVTNTINKHLIPLANKPMIFYAIESAVNAGIEEIFININPGETQLQKNIGDGGHWGAKITFFEQTGGAQGIAHAVKCAENFIGNDPFLFVLSDNIIKHDLKKFLENFTASGDDARLMLATVKDPERSGVAKFSADGKLLEIIEKPSNPPSNQIMTGIMVYGPKVYFEAYNQLKKSARGEYEISGINSYLLNKGYKVGYENIDWWMDTGVPDDLVVANAALLDGKSDAEFTIQGMPDKSAKISGKVHIGAGTTVGTGVELLGPVIIGENCTLENCIVGPHVTIGSGSTVKQAAIKNSIILNNSSILAPVIINDSIIGENSRVAPKKLHDRFLLGEYSFLEI